MPAMDYAQVAELYDAYVQTEMDVPFFLEAAQGCQRVLELTSGTGGFRCRCCGRGCGWIAWIARRKCWPFCAESWPRRGWRRQPSRWICARLRCPNTMI